MTGNRCDRSVASGAGTPIRDFRLTLGGSGRTTFTAWRILCLIVLLGAVPSLHAQQWPSSGGGPYSQGYPQPAGSPYGYYGYPQGYQQPFQRAQNVYYGNYQDNRMPGYIYPRTNYVPNNYGDNGNGVTYYYVQNPNGPNYYPLVSPYGTPPANIRYPSNPTSWPAPTNVAAPSPINPPLGDPELDEDRKPVVSFHRPANECFWFKADYVATFIQPMRLAAPLAAIGSPNDPVGGALGQPSTTVLFGQNKVDLNHFSGVRLEGGLFLDRENRFSLDIVGFYLPPQSQTFSIASDLNGNPLISRPIFNIPQNQEGAIVTSTPGQLAGKLTIENRSEMAGVEFNARFHGYVQERFHLDALVGFRYLRLAESMQLRDQLIPLANNFLTFNGPNNFVNAPDSMADQDLFRTVNQFFGGQIGGRLTWEQSWFTLDGFGKLAVGGTEETTTISGSTTVISAKGNQQAVGGILALPSNIGDHRRTVVGVVPEFGVNVGVELTQNVRLNLGYSLLLWNQVVRPGSQFDRNVSQSQVPGSQFFGNVNGPISPTYRFSDESFWANSLKLGLEFHY